MGFDTRERLAATLMLDEDVTRVPLVSPARARTLAKMGIFTVRDLVKHYPRRYLDMSAVKTVGEARIGTACTIKGTIHAIVLKRPKPRLSLVEITLVDNSGTLIITAFRQPWLTEQLKAGMQIAVAGTLEFSYGYKRMTNPFIEKIEASCYDEYGMIIPVHPASGRLTSAWMRRLVANALELIEGLDDPLPLQLRLKYKLMSRQTALFCIHFPQSMAEQVQARRRLAYEELLLLELILMQQGSERSKGKEPTSHVIDGPCMRALDAALPFTLTEEQQQARKDILDHMSASKTANHLLLGDVGTGKTIVAAFAVAAAADSSTQAAFLVPTEILARQHAKTLGPLFNAAHITWEVLTGSTKPHERAAILDRVAAGTVDVLLGTHALLEDDVRFNRLSLVIVDEQQRFGVKQRAALLAKGPCPDALFLTATPIPRSLALALFGNLTLSYLTQRPHDQANRTTYVHHTSERGCAYDAAREALARGEQVYIVCPLVGEKTNQSRNASLNHTQQTHSGKDEKTKKQQFDRSFGEDEYAYASISIEDDTDMADDNVAAAQQKAELLQATTFIDYQVELIHGKLSGEEKAAIMQRFQDGLTQVLVATTVIEVGIDVPQATVMIVEDADRFGLAQLHQLRGRVGRGKLSGEIHLVSASRSEKALERLAAMEKTDDGFELASYDLALRREGDILGNRQHGASSLKLVNVIRDAQIIETAHDDAKRIMTCDPHLQDPAHKALAREAQLVSQAFDDTHKN